jgi:hypothetical protein
MLNSVSEKIELTRLLARAQGEEEPSKKSALLRAAATEARRWAVYNNRQATAMMNFEGADHDGSY